RLMCCLAYEYEIYREMAKKIPRLGTEVLVEQGKGYIVDVNVIKQTVVVEIEETNNRVEVTINNIKKIFGKSKFKKVEEEEDLKNINLDSDVLEEE
ncbi:stage 0 sporulation protein, partial [bacterium]|nr:stage 0 sporulation protein [bacterium]